MVDAAVRLAVNAHSCVNASAQFAGVPDRGEPDRGTVDYRQVFTALAEAGWDRPLGAEYRPSGRTEDSLGWMQLL